MAVNNQTRNQHLLGRAGFGIAASTLQRLDDITPHKLYKRLEKASATPTKALDTVSPFVKEAMAGKEMDDSNNAMMDTDARKAARAEQRKQINKQSNADIRQLSIAWMNEMVSSEAQLREKMALFWHGHFASRVNNSLYQQQLLRVIRENALGSFGDLLRGVSKSASMLAFLNNQQNRKKKPNENFAREVMELFTLGRGHYSEKDIKEAARAFTGWGFERDGTFVFREKVHDEGMKTILGSGGNFDGDAVLDLILQQKQTALFLCTKIYRYFVNEVVDTQQVGWLADRFYSSQYDIGKLMHDIFTSDWFYEERNIGTHIKSPVEYLAGIRRFLPMTLRNEEVQVLLQRLLGQWLFNPPNVAGWPGGTAWIDSSSLMLRLRIPGLIRGDETISIKPKGNDDVQMGGKELLPAGGGKTKKAGGSYQMLAHIDWTVLDKALDETNREVLYNKLEALLLQTPPGSADKDAVMKLVDQTTDETYLQTLVIALMSTPEYQLC
ncbi:DUF1800 domain-containing protein [Taibaiella koreensis]|uniref:DUF1800 domain-containing protein n=1 Tax=Taibaiella koreensis TaxID=1268548 RepID=UPI000E59DFA7|nr:DUF1800 domain-containing protein [Taibaiella koreensis]